ncbi:SUMF1/EgtB/PvdO family nonheme iron enzyme [candidate division KSB1 bacterium]|nr:SUMF1/EgtB/PvdO family nonheme iron enzyme [candidate division KSB1 bacterium]MBL7094536.1 SUMF1/EgtB/PvdO family nonheme iron enzyme [candidate division KSB1 bacterium]
MKINSKVITCVLIFILSLLTFLTLYSSDSFPSGQTEQDSSATTNADFRMKIQDNSVLLAFIGGIIITLLVGILTFLIFKMVRMRAEQKQIRIATIMEKAKRVESDAQGIKSLEKRYFEVLRAAYQRIKLFGFLSQANIDVGLLDVFVNMRFMEKISSEFDRQQKQLDPLERILSPLNVIQRTQQSKKLLMIFGGAGSGKTTLLRYLTICCLDEEKWKRIGLEKPLIPIIVPLRAIDPKLPFIYSIIEWSRKNNLNLTRKLLEHWLTERGALVLLDGLDEVGDRTTRQNVCQWIDAAYATYKRSMFVVTCRFTGYSEAEGVSLKSPKLRADMLDLNEDQKKIFLFQWFKATGLTDLDEADRQNPESLQLIVQQAEKNRDALMDSISQPGNRSLLDMAGVPVMLQIMATVWKEQGSLPPERVELYDRSTDFLLFHRDKAKGLKPLMSASQTKSILRPLALKMQWEWEKDEVTEEEFLALVEPLIQRINSNLEGLDFLENMRDRAGVLIWSGTRTYSFQHKSIREFFAAEELGNMRLVKPLVQHFDEDWWRETILFASGLSRPSIFTHFMNIFLNSEQNFGETPHLLLQCVSEAVAPDETPFIACLKNKNWQARYNALKCLQLISSEKAKNATQICLKDPNRQVRDLAYSLLLEWDIIKLEPKKELDENLKLPLRFLNQFEHNTEYILIPAGRRIVGGRQIKIDIKNSFYLAKIPVTNRLYQRFIQETGHKEPSFWNDKRFNEPNQPVVGVTWYNAKEYCEWLKQNSKEGLAFRLPTEEEWEWAASRGEREYPWGNEKPDFIRANYGDKVGNTTPVGSYPFGATHDGLMDMAGNVWELTDPISAENKQSVVLRGGSYNDQANNMACSARLNVLRSSFWMDHGFRVACSAQYNYLAHGIQ